MCLVDYVRSVRYTSDIMIEPRVIKITSWMLIRFLLARAEFGSVIKANLVVMMQFRPIGCPSSRPLRYRREIGVAPTVAKIFATLSHFLLYIYNIIPSRQYQRLQKKRIWTFFFNQISREVVFNNANFSRQFWCVLLFLWFWIWLPDGIG